MSEEHVTKKTVDSLNSTQQTAPNDVSPIDVTAVQSKVTILEQKITTLNEQIIKLNETNNLLVKLNSEIKTLNLFNDHITILNGNLISIFLVLIPILGAIIPYYINSKNKAEIEKFNKKNEEERQRLNDIYANKATEALLDSKHFREEMGQALTTHDKFQDTLKIMCDKNIKKNFRKWFNSRDFDDEDDEEGDDDLQTFKHKKETDKKTSIDKDQK